ncbi:hypothetical protein GEV33_000944 [Tenebrio molitor]|uniref:Uncharacterized protein n=1 Tax=Tenebrio molitor TaxID=7067 RepID=A0A8J6HX48_TENMO|nr:hypothetical protein GEV33_000944 [Tenebrio molitor]
MIYVTTIPQVVEIDTVLLTQCAPTWSMETDTIFVILKMVMFYLIPLLFMSVAYLQIIRVLWKSGDVPHQMMDSKLTIRWKSASIATNSCRDSFRRLPTEKNASRDFGLPVLYYSLWGSLGRDDPTDLSWATSITANKGPN